MRCAISRLYKHWRFSIVLSYKEDAKRKPVRIGTRSHISLALYYVHCLDTSRILDGVQKMLMDVLFPTGEQIGSIKQNQGERLECCRDHLFYDYSFTRKLKQQVLKEYVVNLQLVEQYQDGSYGGKGGRHLLKLGQIDEESHSKDWARLEDKQIRRWAKCSNP
nr:hypothetical protein CFP56_34364 [Quercus suber]